MDLESLDEKFRDSWRNVLSWSENKRYLPSGYITKSNCENFIKDTKFISEWILKQN